MEFLGWTSTTGSLPFWRSERRSESSSLRAPVFPRESGIPTFRDADGFWQRFPPEHYATWNGLLTTVLTQPLSVAEFVLNVVEPVAKAEPNAGHHAIVRMEQRVKTTVITQDIDGLHQTAGSNEVLEVHGSLLEVVDTSTGELVKRFGRKDLTRIAECLHQYTGKQQSAEIFVSELQQKFPFDWMGRHRPNDVLLGMVYQKRYRPKHAKMSKSVTCYSQWEHLA